MDVKQFLQSKRPIYWRSRVYVLIASVVFLFLFWSGVTVAYLPFPGIVLSDEGVVEAVVPHSGAAWMGLQEGDVILEINGRPLSEVDYPFADLHAGEWVLYTIARDDNVVMLSAPIDHRPLGRLLLAELPIFLGMIFWSVSLFVLLLAPARSVSVVFFFLGQYTTIMLASGAVASFTHASPEWDIFAVTLLMLVPLTAHFYAIFPSPWWQRYRRLYLSVLYTLALVLAVLYIFEVVKGFREPWPRVMYALRTSFIILGLSFSLVSLLAPRGRASMHSRRVQRLLIAGMLFSVLPTLAFSVVPETIWGQPFIPYYVTMPFLALLPISYAYGMLVGSLHRFDRILKDGLATTAMVLLYLGIYLLASAGMNAIGMHGLWGHLFSAAFVIFLVLCTYVRWRSRVDMWLERAFYGRWYDYRSLLQQHSAHFRGIIALDELARNLLDDVRAMRFVRGIMFWVEGDILHPTQFFGYPADAINILNLRADGPIAQRLQWLAGPCKTEQLLSAIGEKPLSRACQWLLKEARIEVWMPLLTKNGELLGLLALGERQANEPLDRDDWAILQALADQTSLAAENIHLIETLQTQLDLMQEIQEELKEAKWRLAESRERERLELARVLHDGPIQDIYSAVYQLAIWRKIHGRENDPGLKAIEAELMKVEQRLRHFSTELRPPSLEAFGLSGAVRSHLSKLREQYPHMVFDAQLASTREVLSMEERLAFFRVYQEAVRNALRHGQAKHVWVRLYVEAGCVVLEVEDDGRGFEPPARWVEFARRGHFGLLGMAERAEAVGARLEVVAEPGQGTLVRMTLSAASSMPIPRAADLAGMERPGAK